MTKYLSYADVVMLNRDQILRYSSKEDIGVKDEQLLDSAVNRPKQSAFGLDAYPDDITKAVALYESILKNHCFFNANKRTATACLVLFLRINNFRFNMDTKELSNLGVHYTTGVYDTNEVVSMVKNKCIPIDKESIGRPTTEKTSKSISPDFRKKD